MASDANANNTFFTKVLGQRRIKKTVNFDAPDVYHLYYGDETGTPGSVMTYFPFPDMQRGTPGTGEVGMTAYAIPEGAIDFWLKRFDDMNIHGVEKTQRFGESRLEFSAPDGDRFALVETANDDRDPWLVEGISDDVAIRGFHSASMRLKDDGATRELMKFMNYSVMDEKDSITRMMVENGNGAHLLDLETLPGSNSARQGAGSVHHIAFSVDDRKKQLEVREALMDTGYQVTPVIDRDYFYAIYFRTPGGVLFEIATNEPGFDRDEDTKHLGEALKLPSQHEHLRAQLEDALVPIRD